MTNTQPIKRQHPQTPLGALLNKYAISLRHLSDCLSSEGVIFRSKSTLHRLVNNKELSNEMRDYLLPLTAQCLSKFLIARGLPKSEIDHELLSIFTEGEYQPMINQRVELSPQACEHFGFRDENGLGGSPVLVFDEVML